MGRWVTGLVLLLAAVAESRISSLELWRERRHYFIVSSFGLLQVGAVCAVRVFKSGGNSGEMVFSCCVGASWRPPLLRFGLEYKSAAEGGSWTPTRFVDADRVCGDERRRWGVCRDSRRGLW